MLSKKGQLINIQETLEDYRNKYKVGRRDALRQAFSYYAHNSGTDMPEWIKQGVLIELNELIEHLETKKTGSVGPHANEKSVEYYNRLHFVRWKVYTDAKLTNPSLKGRKFWDIVKAKVESISTACERPTILRSVKIVDHAMDDPIGKQKIETYIKLAQTIEPDESNDNAYEAFLAGQGKYFT